MAEGGSFAYRTMLKFDPNPLSIQSLGEIVHA